MTDLIIAGIELVTFNLDRAIAFYRDGLGFVEVAELIDGDDRVALLKLGSTELRLRHPAEPGLPYPEPMAANDPWFQHFAIAVSNADAACELVKRAGACSISKGGPVSLPPSSGSVTAWKFRDPEGHPLELSAYPDDPRAQHVRDECVFLAVDHTAIAVSDLNASLRFYTELGFRETGRGINQGATQARLDGLADPTVEIVVLEANAGPHLELLHYRSPRPAVARCISNRDIAATRTLLAGLSGAVEDPDGHRMQPIDQSYADVHDGVPQ